MAVATVLTVYGIETDIPDAVDVPSKVATVLTVYGIETLTNSGISSTESKLQQYLPFTVLKR